MTASSPSASAPSTPGPSSPDDRPAVLFDLDGTLVDTTYLHVLAWWRALDEAGCGHAMSEIHPLIGMGSDQLLARLRLDGRDDLSEGHGRHFAGLSDLVRALPGASDLLRRTAAAGGRVLLVTSAKPDQLGPLLDPLGASDAIEEVFDSGRVAHAKPAPDLFTTTIDACGLDTGRVVAVGDAVWDVEAAGRAGIPCVALRTGGINAADLTGAGAAAVYDDCAAVLADWDRSPLGRLLATADAPSPP